MSVSPSKNKLKLRLEMKADWHVGTGSGIPGSIDALLARDADGFPCIPAKTIVGIWRDAMETLTFGLDNGSTKNPDWQRWVGAVFGSQPAIDKIPTETPRPSILSIQPARLGKNLRDAIGTDKRLRQALTFIKPNTAIDFASGTARSESLRFSEMGRIGTILETDFGLDFTAFKEVSSEPRELTEALLVASAALIERIGGNRRRGSGKCEVQVEGLVSVQDAVSLIRKYQTAPGVPELKLQEGSGEPAKSASGDKWKKVKYVLKLQTPVAIVSNTLGNVSETLDFIPGTYLLPHVTKTLKGISRYVASGDFQVLPATIEVNKTRGMPVPRVFLQEKLNESNVCSRLKETAESISTKSQLKPLREGFVSMTEGVFTHARTPKVLLMHNTVDDPVQRPTENVGGVFSRQAIEAGTTLHGEIRLKETIAEALSGVDQNWIDKLNSIVRLGTSRKDDYGVAQFTVGEIEVDPSGAPVVDNELIVYCESDVLIRGGDLRQSNLVADLKYQLESHLGGPGKLKSVDELISEAHDLMQAARSKLEQDPNDEQSIRLIEEKGRILGENEMKQSLIQVRRIESWHEAWGIPRPTLTAIAAGSVAIFQTTGSINENSLHNLELTGIGERRGEGYGRIRINPSLLTSTVKSWVSATKRSKGTGHNSEALQKLKEEMVGSAQLKEFVSIIELSVWRNELARAVLKLANGPTKRQEVFGFEIFEKQGKKNSVPSLSQIGGLRSSVGRLKKPKDPHFIGWLDHLEETSNRLELWDKGKNKTQAKKKLEKIKTLINDPNEVWNILKKSESISSPYLVGEFATQGAEIQSVLWIEAVKALFDSCARAHKREVERQEKKEGNANG